MAEPNPTKQPDSDLNGTTLNNRYRVMEKLGHGGMGTVYRGVHIFMERPVAIKVLHAHLITNKDFIQRFLHEARINSKLSHRNAVILYDFGVEGQMPYLVFEFVEGLTLREVLVKDGRLSIDRFINIVTQVGQALAHAHALGIVHRDLKPDNIMIGHRDPLHEHACVLDFGIAKVLHNSAGQERTVVTQMGMVMGTPQYLSPEQALEKELDARSDIYSLGIIMYEMLTGEVPFKSPSSPLEILVQHLNTKPKPIRALKPELNIPQAIADAAMKCLAKEKEERFQSIAELLAALEEGRPPEPKGIVPSAPKPADEPLRPAPVKETKRRRSPAWVLLPLAVLCSLLAVYFLSRQTPAGESSTEIEKTAVPFAAEPEVKLQTQVAEPPAVPVAKVPPKPVAESVLPVPLPAGEDTPFMPAAESARLFGISSISVESTESLSAFFADNPLQPVAIVEPPPAEQVLSPELAALTADDIPLTSTSSPLSASQFEARLSAAKKLLQQGRHLEAAREYQALLRARGNHLNARLSLGTAYLKLGAYEAAVREFDRLLEIEPEFAPAVYMLAAYYAVKNQPVLALSHLERALKLYPGMRKWLGEDKEFDSLRANEQFQKLISGK